MDVLIQIELDKLRELIVNAVPVEQIYLFGSYAYGIPWIQRAENDISTTINTLEFLPPTTPTTRKFSSISLSELHYVISFPEILIYYP